MVVNVEEILLSEDGGDGRPVYVRRFSYPEDTPRYAHVVDGVVHNIFPWDGVYYDADDAPHSPSPPVEGEWVRLTAGTHDQVSVGWLHNGGKRFSRPDGYDEQTAIPHPTHTFDAAPDGTVDVNAIATLVRELTSAKTEEARQAAVARFTGGAA